MLKTQGIIINTLLFDFDKISNFIHVIIVLELKQTDDIIINNKNLMAFLNSCINVNNLSLTERGFFLDAVFQSMIEYERFIRVIKDFELLGLAAYFILERISQEKFCPR